MLRRVLHRKGVEVWGVCGGMVGWGRGERKNIKGKGWERWRRGLILKKEKIFAYKITTTTFFL